MYLVNNLKENQPDVEVEEMVKLMREIQLEKMKDKDCGDLEITEDDFKDVLDKFRSKLTVTYDFILKAGIKYQNAIHELCKTGRGRPR